MEIGAEISQKIRSAITAKLVDLGAYVDDELPDYIMVMIANKKSKAQMTEDLNLFLGNNTERFTQWLHALLSKLQTITGDSQKSGSAPSASASTGSNTQGAPPTQPQSHGTNGTANTDSVGSASNTAAKLAVQRERETAAEEPEEPVIKLRADNDEFAEEEPVSSPVTSPKKKENKVAPRVRDPAPSQVVPKTRAVTVTRVQPRLRPTAEPAMRSDRIKPVQQMKVVKTVARKRKMPGSVVGSVVKHYSEEEDEGYDPLKPAIGSVASVIRVTERKSSVPHHLQANKNLVMKAVQEAHQSLEHLSRKVDITTAHAHAEQAVVRPMESMVADRVTVKTRHRKTPIVRSTMHKQRVTRTRGSPISKSTAVQLVSRSKREEQVGRLTHTSSSKGQGGQKDEETVDEAVRHVLGGEDEFVSEEESTPSPESVESSTEVDCRLVECNDEETDIRKPVVVKVANPPQNKHAPKLAEAKPQPVTILLHPQPSSDISEEEEEEEDSGESKTQGGESESLQGQEDEEYRDVESESEEVSYEVQQEEQKEDIKRTIKQKHRHKERPVSPKFVVTLDGVDPKLLKDAVPMEIDSDEERQLTGQTSEEQHLPQVTVDMGDTSGEYDQEDEVPTKKSKLPERCKFWPSCKNGESCAFHHPNTQCTVFPKCRFGDKCLYIHPNCKFDANCTRPNCPYTHASKRPTTVPVVLQPIQVPVMSTPKPSYATQPKATSPTSPGQIKCRFFPACTNMSCRFKHPKPCRYGISCNNKEKCPFTHPQLPDRKKLKWSSAPSKLGESTSLTKT